MKLKSVSGVVLHVKDLRRTSDFYEGLGFRLGKRESNRLTIYLNWYWLEFQEGENVGVGKGQFIAINVEDIDEAHRELVEKGLKPLDEPQEHESGRREFILEDPDKYQLLFFSKK
jgi:catechol 2,3-dioxygenase-like lactoylglutathione lyase family enzyme